MKLVIDEEYSPRVRDYLFAPNQSWRLCTSFCFAEAFGALKLKNKRGELSNRAYLTGSRRLIRLARERLVKVQEGNFASLAVFAEAERMVKTHRIDFIDAFQLISINAAWPELAPPSQAILVTADNHLAKAAKREGIKYWYCRETHLPRC